VLANEEKWKTRGKLDAATITTNATGKETIIDDDDSSEEGKKRSSTPHSVTNTRRNVLGRKAAKDMKGKKAGDDDIAIPMDRIANARLQANEDRKWQETWSKRSRLRGRLWRRGLLPTRRGSWHWKRRSLPMSSTNA
jgi:hypothetical protein